MYLKLAFKRMLLCCKMCYVCVAKYSNLHKHATVHFRFMENHSISSMVSKQRDKGKNLSIEYHKFNVI